MINVCQTLMSHCQSETCVRICLLSAVKQRHKTVLFFGLLLLFSTSCHQALVSYRGSKEIYAALKKSESLMAYHLDSTLSILDQMAQNLALSHVLYDNVEKLEEAVATQQALEGLLLAWQQAQDVQYKRTNNFLLITLLSLLLALFITGTLFYRYKVQKIGATVRRYEELLKYKKEAQQYENSLAQNLSEQLAHSLQHLFETKKVYRQQGLTVDNVAKRLKTNSKYLANAIKENYRKSFIEYVNTYRVEEAIEMLKEQCEGGKYAHYSVEMIAEAVGFNGRTSFYSAFKRIIGVAPKEYISILGQQKDVEGDELLHSDGRE